MNQKSPLKGLYEKILETVTKPSAKIPRLSAAVVMWRRNDEGKIEVYWIQRSKELVFMPGWYAFPGGASSQKDSGVPVAPLHGQLVREIANTEERIQNRDLIAGAARELFEETGVLLTEKQPDDPSVLDDWRQNVLDDESVFEKLVRELQTEIQTNKLEFAGKWTTPPFELRCFENRFFLVEWPKSKETQPRVIPGELSQGEWILAEEAYLKWKNNEVVTSPPIVHILRVLAQDGPRKGLKRLQNPKEAYLGVYLRVELRPGVILIPTASRTLLPATHTNTYLIGFKDCILVDPGAGFGYEKEKLYQALEEAEEKLGRKIKEIWLTHHHPDHVDSASFIQERFGVPIACHEAAKPLIERKGIKIDRTLSDGETITLSEDPPFAVKVLHIPGHTKGHLGFWIEQENALLCGDHLSALSTVIIEPPEGDMATYMGSLERIQKLKPALLFPAHGPAIKEALNYVQDSIEHRKWREQRILEAWNDGIHNPNEIFPKAYENIPEALRPLAEIQIQAHLDYLKRQEKI